MRLVAFEPHHIEMLANYGGQEHLVGHFRERDLQDLAEGNHAYTGFVEDRIVGCAGFLAATPYRATAWALLAKCSPRDFPIIHKAALRGITESGFKRIEAYVDPKSHAAMRWIKMLGFTLERAYLPFYFPNGSGASAWVLYPKGR